jgi:hypothetical protein
VELVWLELVFPPPQLGIKSIEVIARPIIPTLTAFFADFGFRLSPPSSIPVVDVQIKRNVFDMRLCMCDPIAEVAGPLVEITRLTVCAPLAPAGIKGNEHVAPNGRPLHVKLTAVTNVFEPTGNTSKLSIADCPAFTLSGALPPVRLTVNKELNVTGIVCETRDISVPMALMLKL